MASMSSLKAVVRDGRLVLNEPTDLPDGTIIELIPTAGDDMDEAELAKLDAALAQSAAQARAGQSRPASELVAKIRASR